MILYFSIYLSDISREKEHMKIGFDAKRAAQNRTGLGNYSRFVLQLLMDCVPENDYVLYVPDPEKCSLLSALKGKFMLRFPDTCFWKRFCSLWRVWGMTRNIEKDGIDLYHGLSNELPLTIRKAKQTKSIVTIHDLIFLRHPSCYPVIDRLIYNYKFRRACRNADRIIAVSECTKRDIVSLYHVDPGKIDVVYQSCDKRFKHVVPEEEKLAVKEKYALPDKFVLSVSIIEKRKTLMFLAKAICSLDESYKVVAVGKYTPYAGKVKKFLKRQGQEHRLLMIHNVPFKELPAFYQLATTFVYPSFYEGFGIPLLEALNSGVPVIGAHGSCLEESGGPFSLYVPPTDAKALAKAIERTYSDSVLRENMIREGKKYAEKFEPEYLAGRLLEVYHKTLK